MTFKEKSERVDHLLERIGLLSDSWTTNDRIRVNQMRREVKGLIDEMREDNRQLSEIDKKLTEHFKRVNRIKNGEIL